jgi:hypothetical protein
MRRLLLAALVLPFAAPVMAQGVQPVLPFAPRGVDYVESVCTGGFDGRYEQTRILSNGQIMKVTRRSGGVLRARATRAEVTKIWRELDFARFERRVVPPAKPYVMDGIDCALTRRLNGRVHTVTLMQQSRNKLRYRDLVQALDDVNELGRRATGPVLRPAVD